MHMLKLAFPVCAALALSAFGAPTPSAPRDPCKVLTAAQFGKIMGYEATINKTASTGLSCFYTGPGEEGGQFMILTEAADESRAEAMTKPRKGSTPPAGSGLVGGMFSQGSVVFSVSIRSNDQAKLQALVAEIKRGLK